MSAPVVALSDAHEGKVPAVTLYVGAGDPVAWKEKLPATFSAKMVLFKLVITGACWTVSVAPTELAVTPTPLLTSTRNWSPLIASVVLEIVSVAVVEPEYTPATSVIARKPPTPPAERYHW